MTEVFDLLLILAVALNFVFLGVSRTRAVINAVAAQGALIGTFPLFVHPEIGLRGILLGAVTIALKGRIIPSFLIHAMREADIQHEVEPVVGFIPSLLLGAVGTTGTITVEARMKDTTINSAITSLTLDLTSVDAKQWSCTGGTLGLKHRPASCR